MVGKTEKPIDKLPTKELIDELINRAIKLGANFIHIEPRKDLVIIRCRVNGLLVETNRISKKRFDSLLGRIKSLANLDGRITNIPQEGRFKIENGEQSYTLRVSILPTIDGEKVAINLLNNGLHVPTLEQLGYWGRGLEVVSEALNQNKGLILLAGLNDSGKSISLLSMLSKIQSPAINVATIEDPVEYHLNGVNQTQVNNKTNLTFAVALKTLASHDVNVIMISDLADRETIHETLDLAAKNKLILVGVYASSVPEAIHKLSSSGINPSVLAGTLTLASSQRLAQRICPDCRVSFKPAKAMLDSLEKIFSLDNPDEMRELHELEAEYSNFENSGSKRKDKDLSTTESTIKRLYRASPEGCEGCNNGGYTGRIGLFEVIKKSAGIERMINTSASPKVFLSQAYKEGAINVLLDGLIKCLRGEVSIDEILRLSSEVNQHQHI